MPEERQASVITIRNPQGAPGIPLPIARDESLTWGEKGLLFYLASRPDGKETTIHFMAALSKDSEDVVRGYIGALKTAGYLNLERTSDVTWNLHVNSDKIQGNVMSGFDMFWENYPKKTAKVAAQRAWKSVAAAEHINLILDKLSKFKSSPDWKKEGGTFIPHPATWLNGRRWEDEVFIPKIRRGPNI